MHIEGIPVGELRFSREFLDAPDWFFTGRFKRWASVVVERRDSLLFELILEFGASWIRAQDLANDAALARRQLSKVRHGRVHGFFR